MERQSTKCKNILVMYLINSLIPRCTGNSYSTHIKRIIEKSLTLAFFHRNTRWRMSIWNHHHHHHKLSGKEFQYDAISQVGEWKLFKTTSHWVKISYKRTNPTWFLFHETLNVKSYRTGYRGKAYRLSELREMEFCYSTHINFETCKQMCSENWCNNIMLYS